MGFKYRRTEEDIRRQVSFIIKNLKNMSLASKEIGVTRVDLNKDGSFAKIYISSIKGSIYSRQAVAVLTRASGFIRHEISKNLRLKKVPNILFFADEYIEYSRRLEEIFLRIKKI